MNEPYNRLIESTMKKKNVCVAFSTQKGGAGKTTLTVLTASYLYYVKGYSVAVVDCDYPQYSIARMRERDIRMATEDDYYKRLAYEQLTRLGKKAYPVVESSTKKTLANADYLLPQGDYDIVFFDLPGTINERKPKTDNSPSDFVRKNFRIGNLFIPGTLQFVKLPEHIGVISVCGMLRCPLIKDCRYTPGTVVLPAGDRRIACDVFDYRSRNFTSSQLDADCPGNERRCSYPRKENNTLP